MHKCTETISTVRTAPNVIRLSTLINGGVFERHYEGYTRKEAMQEFKRMVGEARHGGW